MWGPDPADPPAAGWAAGAAGLRVSHQTSCSSGPQTRANKSLFSIKSPGSTPITQRVPLSHPAPLVHGPVLANVLQVTFPKVSRLTGSPRGSVTSASTNSLCQGFPVSPCPGAAGLGAATLLVLGTTPETALSYPVAFTRLYPGCWQGRPQTQ